MELDGAFERRKQTDVTGMKNPREEYGQMAQSCESQSVRFFFRSPSLSIKSACCHFHFVFTLIPAPCSLLPSTLKRKDRKAEGLTFFLERREGNSLWFFFFFSGLLGLGLRPLPAPSQGLPRPPPPTDPHPSQFSVASSFLADFERT